jgi:hypothetical protein
VSPTSIVTDPVKQTTTTAAFPAEILGSHSESYQDESQCDPAVVEEILRHLRLFAHKGARY